MKSCIKIFRTYSQQYIVIRRINLRIVTTQTEVTPHAKYSRDEIKHRNESVSISSLETLFRNNDLVDICISELVKKNII